jgi:hypothetical protein
MMYLTAMRINSRRDGIGVNIYLHLKPGAPDTQDPWKVMDDPGPAVREVAREEVRPGGNRVEAYLDLLLDEHAYSAELLTGILDEAAKAIEMGRPNPAKMEFPDRHGGVVRVAFSVNLGLEDLTSKRRIFRQLRSAIERWQDRHSAAIEAARHGRRAAG